MRILVVVLGVGALGALAAFTFRYVAPPPAPPLPKMAAAPESALVRVSLPIRRGDNLDNLLVRAGIEDKAKWELIGAVREAFDVKKFRAGTELTLVRTMDGSLDSIEYIIDPDHKLRIKANGTGYGASVVEIPGTVRPVLVRATLEGSLFESIQRVGESPELAMRMADIFGWDLDFYTDPRAGDQFCLLVEKKEYDNGQPPTYQRILSAKYINSGELYEAFLYPDKDGKPQYYSRDGKSLQAAFLRSPLKFSARISSHFSRRRFHPILKIYRPHLGIDYAAPTGTPVQAIASGRVTFSGRNRGSGNIVKIRHTNGFETMYMHLSRRLVRKGQRVSQGQRIGLVGATGLATGPHLDFRLRKNGKYLNFERIRPPRKSRIPARQMAEFEAERDRLTAMMEPVYGPASPQLAGEASADDRLAVD